VISIFQAIILGLVQGFTELFPISSLGHSVIIPSLLGWNIQQNASYFLTFLVATHLATALALLVFFWRDWVLIVKGIVRSIASRGIQKDDTYAKLGWLLIIATIPAGILGLVFQKKISDLFASAQLAAAFLIVNGLILFTAEWLRTSTNRRRTRQQTDESIAKLHWWQGAGIGVAQACALIPGISRSGASMAASMFAGLNNEAAARFSFLLATPVIGAAALLKLPDLATHSEAPLRGAFIVGAVCAGVAAYLSTRFLIRYFQTKTLTPFAIYCVVAGSIYSAILMVR
jgi:undecaprenyl-diphosphatase